MSDLVAPLHVGFEGTTIRSGHSRGLSQHIHAQATVYHGYKNHARFCGHCGIIRCPLLIGSSSTLEKTGRPWVQFSIDRGD